MNDAAPWLERELARQLAPVAAPESLWYQIQEQRRLSPRRDSLRWTLWPAIAILTLFVCAGAFREIDIRGAERLTPQDLAELARNPKDLDFRSSDFGAIRSWVKAKANIDIDVPEGMVSPESAAVRVIGVRLVRLRGLPVAAIDCRFGADRATLVVSAKRAGHAGNEVGKHLFAEGESGSGTRMVSWNMRNQNYAIAFAGAGDANAACMLCHANLPGLIAIN